MESSNQSLSGLLETLFPSWEIRNNNGKFSLKLKNDEENNVLSSHLNLFYYSFKPLNKQKASFYRANDKHDSYIHRLNLYNLQQRRKRKRELKYPVKYYNNCMSA